MISIASDYTKVFNRLCHFVALSKEGKTKEAIDHLIQTIFVTTSPNHFTNVREVREAIYDYFGLQLSTSSIQDSIQRLLSKGIIYRNTNNTYRLTEHAQAAVESRIFNAVELEGAVRTEWLEEIKQFVPRDLLQHSDRLWNCLQSYMSKVFMRHGVETIRLLSSDIDVEMSDLKTLSSLLNEAISQECEDMQREIVAECIRNFFRTPTPKRTRYLVQLLDGTFTFFSLTIDNATARYLRQSIKPLLIFLDTNFIFGVLELHSNPFVEVSKELIDIINNNKFPFKLYYHQETLKEIRRTLDAIGHRLKSQRWQPSISRAAIRTGQLSGLELRYHEKNAESPIDPDVFLSKYEGIVDLLKDHGFTVYRDSYKPNDQDTEREERLIAEYDEFVQRVRKRPKPYEALNHDIVVWNTVRRIRKQGASVLDIGAVFLTADFYLYLFDWQHLRIPQEPGHVVLPNHFLQLLRPFVPATDDFDRRFVETFAIPEFRAIDSDYSKTSAKILSYINAYADISEETAVRILSNSMLVEQLKDVDEQSEEFAEAIENALARDNEILIEEKEALLKEKAEAEERAKEAEEEKRRVEEALRRVEREREEAEKNKSEVLRETAEVRELAEKLAEELKAQQEKVRQLTADQEKYKLVARIVVGMVLALAGCMGIAVLPGILKWTWLVEHSNSLGLRGSAILAWFGVSWAIVDRKRWKWSLGAVGLGAILVILQLL